MGGTYFDADCWEGRGLNITEVRVKLMHHRSDRLRAFCSITIDDDFVVHDLRVIEGRKGFFVAMPSRKLSDNCGKCGAKNELRARYCGECGDRLDENRAVTSGVPHDKLHVDVAHPINTPCREMLQQAVLEAYKEEAALDEARPAPDADDHVYPDDDFEDLVQTLTEATVETQEAEIEAADMQDAEVQDVEAQDVEMQHLPVQGVAPPTEAPSTDEDVPGEDAPADEPNADDVASPEDSVAGPDDAPGSGRVRRRPSGKRQERSQASNDFGDGIL